MQADKFIKRPCPCETGPFLIQWNGRASVRQRLEMVNTARKADLHKAEIGALSRQVIHGGSVTHIWNSFLPFGDFLFINI